jgi:hypothetical protein
MSRNAESKALFVDVDSKKGVNYKRYVTRECSQDAKIAEQIQTHLSEKLRKQVDEAVRLTEKLRELDSIARSKLPDMLNEMSQFRIASGAIQADVQRAINSVHALDEDGKTCAYLWLSQSGATGGYDQLLKRKMKLWTKLNPTAKREILRKCEDFQLLLDTTNVRIAPAKGVRECSNMLIRRGCKNDFFDVVAQDTIDFTDTILHVHVPEASFCIPADHLRDRKETNPIDFTDNWGASATRQPRSYHAKTFSFAVHPRCVFRQVEIPVFRLLRIMNVL